MSCLTLIQSRRLIFVVLVALASCAPAQRVRTPEIDQGGVPERVPQDTTLKVMTLNMAHAKGNRLHQLFQGRERHEEQLEEIAELLEREQPHLLALQEADRASFWSGRIDHVGYLGDSFSQSVYAEHMDGPQLSSGTAALSSLPLTEPHAATFSARWFAAPRGFVIARVDWPGVPELSVDVVSVHLDYLRPNVREAQAGEIIETLRKRDRPLILMGDFNTSYKHDSAVCTLIRALKLRAPPEVTKNTFPRFGLTVDWILISKELEYRSYEVLDDVVSDHRAVVAGLGPADNGTPIRQACE